MSRPRLRRLVRRLGSAILPSPGGSLDLCPLTLRFPHPGTERGFSQSQAAALPHSIFMSSLLVTLQVITSGVIFSVTSDNRNVYDFSTKKGKQIYNTWLTLNLMMLGLSLFTCILSRCKPCLLRLPPVMLEVLATGYMAASLAGAFGTSLWYSSLMMGENPRALLKRDACNFTDFTDAGALQVVFATMTVGQFVLEVRWCVLWVLDIFGILAYVMMAGVLGSPENGWMVNLNVNRLMFFVLFLTMGKRKLEVHQRHLFAGLLAEKMLRCQSEFQCEQLFSQLDADPARSSAAAAAPNRRPTTARTRRSGPWQAPAAEVLGEPRDFGEIHSDGLTSLTDGATFASAASTTTTGRLFDAVGEACPVELGLGAFAKVGREEFWLLNPDDLRLAPSQVLGGGSRSVVVQGQLFGQTVAVKVARNTVPGTTSHFPLVSRNLPAIASELRVLRHVRHPNVAFFFGACVDPVGGRLAVVLERVNGSPLSAIVQTGTPFMSRVDRTRLLLDICGALRFLHERRPLVVHGNLKASNVLVELAPRTFIPKLVDFGFSRVVTPNARPMSLTGGACWLPPEMFWRHRTSPTPAVDVFSLGLLIYFMVTNKVPLREAPLHTGPSVSDLSFTDASAASSPTIWGSVMPTLAWSIESNWAAFGQAIAVSCLQFCSGDRPLTVEVHAALEEWLEETQVEDAVGAVSREVAQRLEPAAACWLDWEEGLRVLVQEQQRQRSEGVALPAAPAALTPADVEPMIATEVFGQAQTGGTPTSQRGASSAVPSTETQKGETPTLDKGPSSAVSAQEAGVESSLELLATAPEHAPSPPSPPIFCTGQCRSSHEQEAACSACGTRAPAVPDLAIEPGLTTRLERRLSERVTKEPSALEADGQPPELFVTVGSLAPGSAASGHDLEVDARFLSRPACALQQSPPVFIFRDEAASRLAL